MEPITPQLANAVADNFGGVNQGPDQLEIAWNADPVAPGDQARFEHLISDPDTILQSVGDATALSNQNVSTIGNVILDNLQALKVNEEHIQTELLASLDKEDISTADMMRVQFQLMSLSIEIQTSSNIAHHGVEDIKTVMRGQ
ncbi:hypothetical protein AB1K70_03190 [Bremerella sp. JC770]|uniref:hypothetical protein n=1 Tax=Bremerella sp. JC770 TaxID=3232137 RepID=UPI00345895C3